MNRTTSASVSATRASDASVAVEGTSGGPTQRRSQLMIEWLRRTGPQRERWQLASCETAFVSAI